MTKTRLLAIISFLLLVFVATRALFDRFEVRNRQFTIREVRELTESRAEARPVQFRGVVTLWQDTYFVVQDNSGGIKVRLAAEPKSSLYGHLITVMGSTPVGPGEDSIIQASLMDHGLGTLPQPRVVTADDLQSSNFDGTLVTLRGITCPGHFSGENEIVFHTRLDGVEAQIRVSVSDLSAARATYANADVEFTGVASTGVSAEGKVTNFTLFVQDRQSISVKSASLNFRNLPVRTIAEMGDMGKPVSSLPSHLRGALRETPDRQGLELTDSTGSIPLRVVDGSGYSEADVDVVGFVDREGSKLVLDEALVLGANTGQKNNQVLTTVAALRTLPADEARLEKPVELDAVVTYNNPVERLAFVEDKTAGIFVWSNDLNSRFLLGDRIKLRGVTGPGDFAPIIMPSGAELLGHSTALPKPGQFSDEDIFAGRADSQWIELDGVVRDNKMDAGQYSLLIAHNGYRFRVLFPGNSPLPSSLINARVKVRGVCSSIFNSTRQLLGIRMYAQSADQVNVLQPSKYGPFNGPTTPIAKLATFAPAESAGYRLHVHGNVLATSPTGPTWIRDATGAVLIRDHGELQLFPGDDVDAAGFETIGTSAAEIENAELRRNGPGPAPQSITVTSDEALSGERNGQLVQIDARLVDQFQNGQERIMLAQAGRNTFTVRSKAPLAKPVLGSLLRLTGICVQGPGAGEPSFELVLRSRADLKVLGGSPWLTRERAYSVLGILASLVLAACVWVAILRRRVNRQTKIISDKLMEVERLKERAESGSRAKSEFLANISHEIRTPMNGILGMTELALEQPLEASLRDTLRMVKSSGDSLLSIVNNILDLSKVEAGKLELEMLECNLTSCIEEIIHLLAGRAHAKDLELICDLSADLPEIVVTDASRLRQILTNLLGNAIKFTDHGEVELSASPENRDGQTVTVHFAIRDTGIGIPREKQAIIFSAFTQADASTTRLYGGSGLGLSIASQLASLLGGRIWVESQVGHGSTFHFTAPLKIVQPAGRGNEFQELAALRGRQALIIDKNAASTRVLTKLLQSLGIHPTAAGTPEEGELMARHRMMEFSLVFCDSRLREKLAGCRELSSARLILMGARGKNTASESSGEHYLPKPILRYELLSALTEKPNSQNVEAADPIRKADSLSRHLEVLVVEDNRINQIVARRLIERYGGEVSLAADGRDAVEALEARKFDVVFMDIQMPGMDGLEVTREIRARERGTSNHQYIVAMTAHAMAADRERCLAAGMDDYLSKPIQPPKLKAILETAEARMQSAIPPR